MMKNSTLFTILSVCLVGCAVQPTPDPDPVDETVCGDGVCNGDEDSESCPADCNDDSPVCGDGVCEDPETADSCSADCEDAEPPPESKTWVCRGGVDGGRDYFECNSEYLADAPDSVWFVGECPSEGIYGYFAGRKVEVPKAENGWYRLYLEGDADVTCEITYAQCSNGTDPFCWAQYGRDSVSAEIAGPYRGCYESGSCGMFLSRNPGKTPNPEGD